MCQVIAKVIEVCPETIATDRLARRRRVGKSFVSRRDPQAMQYPAVASVYSEPRRVTLLAKRSDLGQQCIELEQGDPADAQRSQRRRRA